ncbi:4-cresol dehydrogenase [Amycolatopsis deserti]|uniref:4-cresol dehydrogenase n=1 Tax=Amycolatopsis deserti TaxID=185696 RepID=A0ABQ3IEJ2_9PSEU|nr:FAD-binding oxidoreductase [Amycolatopsis deserti]GHE80670.1 4-cresol dehydrogenase [Amycolatopsis deserti]
MTSVVPDGISPVAVDKAIEKLTAELGAESVVTAREDLLEFRDPYAYRESDEFDASAMVLPTTTEQVQAITRIAGEYGVPLWTFSQGRNNTYGGPAPRLRGSVLVNLRKMNRILEIDTDLAYAVVEPGVRWFDLHEALEREGGELWASIPDLGWGSVIGNSLEYGIGYTPYGDHARNICGLEVVLPDGSLLRTGMGAMDGNPARHTYPHSYGPSVAGLFQQSNLGIVTSTGWWLMRRPETYLAGWARFHGYEALGAVVDGLRGLLLDRTIENHPMFTRGYEVDENGVGHLNPDGDGWVVRFALYGRQPVVDAQYRTIEATLGRLPGVELAKRVFSGTDLTGPANHDERVQRGIPDMDLLDPQMLPYGADTGHLDFSPVGPATGDAVVRTEQLVRSIYARQGRAYVNGIFLTPRSALHISTTFFDPRDEQETEAVYANYSELVHELAKTGYAPYRTNLAHMDLVADQFGFGDHAQLRFAEKLKDALDPRGILAPGKSGIWPATLRPGRDRDSEQ